MEAPLATSILLARHRADVAMAVAAKMAGMRPGAAERLMESVSDSADKLERSAGEVATETGKHLNIRV